MTKLFLDRKMKRQFLRKEDLELLTLLICPTLLGEKTQKLNKYKRYQMYQIRASSIKKNLYVTYLL